MKIIAVARNYPAHAREMNHAIPDEPVIFMKPATALLKDNKPFYFPDFSKNMHYETEIVLKVCKNGKNIAEKFTSDYYDEVTVGIDFTARDIQSKCKEKGWPWEKAKAFDNSAATGKFIPLSDIKDINNLNFSLKQNQQLVQEGNTKDMLFGLNFLISHISQYFTLQQGDLIFTGTPFGVGPVQVGDLLEAYIENQHLLSCEIK